MRYQVVDVLSAIDYVKPLLEKHWEEIAFYKDKIKLDPEWDFYKSLGDNIHCVVAFNEDKVVGYFVCFIKEHPHYKNSLWAQNDVLYIDPEYRGKGVGKGMIQFAEKALKYRGVEVLNINMKVNNLFDELLKDLDYNPYECIYSKFIGD
jgi:GNAT superfamily N-acetyltransferase